MYWVGGRKPAHFEVPSLQRHCFLCNQHCHVLIPGYLFSSLNGKFMSIGDLAHSKRPVISGDSLHQFWSAAGSKRKDTSPRFLLISRSLDMSSQE